MKSTRPLATPTLAAFAGLALCAPRAAAQSQLYEFCGETYSDLFGMSVAGGGDLNADGHPDVVVGGYRGAYNGGFSGVVRVFSGLDGALLLDQPGEPGQGLGSRVDFAGDVDGDGYDDVLAASLWGAATRVYSGQSGAELLILPGASFTAWGFGDHDGDGFDDVLVGDTIYAGSSGGALISFPAAEAYSPAGDVDGDGVRDVLGFNRSGAPYFVRAYSGANAGLLHDVPLAGEFQSANGVGDVDADGLDDFAIDRSSSFLGTWAIEVHSGASGAVLYELPELGGTLLLGAARTIDPAGDVDGDGHGDFVAAGLPGAALVSGRTGCILARFASDEVQGYVVASAGDVDLDGRPDFVLGDPLFHGTNIAGKAGVFSYDGPLGASFCSATPNSTGFPALMSASGSTSVGANDLELAAGPVPASQPGLFYYGPAQTQLPFGNGFRCVAPGGAGLFRLDVVSAGAGGCLHFAPDLSAPPSPAGQIAPGSSWSFQAWYRDPAAGGAGFDLSDGLELVFVP